MGNYRRWRYTFECWINTKTNDTALPSSKLSVLDITVNAKNKIGDWVEEDCRCDSTYMLGVIYCVGAVIMQSYYWIDLSQKFITWWTMLEGHCTNVAI